MTYIDLKKAIPENIFKILDVVKLFPNEKTTTVRTQLYRLAKSGFLTPIKRGLYCFDKSKVGELELAQVLYSPSYISLETALNFYGVIPDIPISITSVTPITTKKITTSFGVFSYQKVDCKLFFGFLQTPFNIARKEKALLDYLYLKKIKRASPEMRLQLKDWSWKLFKQYAAVYPLWIRRIKLQ